MRRRNPRRKVAQSEPQHLAKQEKEEVESTGVPESKNVQPLNPRPIRSELANNPFERSTEEALISSSNKSSVESEQEAQQDIVSNHDASNENATNEVLHSSQQPVIVSNVEGPRKIIVGHEATYQVSLENISSTDANQVATVVRVPEWAEFVDAISSSGSVTRIEEGDDSGALQWEIDKLTAKASETLRLRIIPRSGRPLQLGVEWSQAPSSAKTMLVEVQEPKLEMSISGPEEVLFGRPQRYQMILRNPGTGLTENISVRLVPPGGDPQSAATQYVGHLEPGELKQIELELTAREGGNLLIEASASASGGIEAETLKQVVCLKPELDIDWRGPTKNYAGTVAAYYFRVKNPGTATTDPVVVNIKLPHNAKFVAASDGHTYNSSTGELTWRLSGIAVHEEEFMQVRCELGTAGANQFEVEAQTQTGDLHDYERFKTDVVALADLQLDVNDPLGPAAVGESVVYEILIRNRGTSAAQNVSIVGLFSEGIEPTGVEGAQFTMRDGRVTFQPIKALSPEHEIRLRIRAVASEAGTHIFRAEATCREHDIKLAVEETTRFYEDEHRWENATTPYTAERRESLNR